MLLMYTANKKEHE